MYLGQQLANDEADAFAALAAGGSLQVRTGTPPATANTTASGTLLATLTLQSPAFTVSANVATIIGNPEALIGADGVVGYARLLSNTSVPIMDVTIGTSGTDVLVNKTSFVTGETIIIQSFYYTRPYT